MSFTFNLFIAVVIFIIVQYGKRIVTRLTVVKSWDENTNKHGKLEEVVPGIYRVTSVYRKKSWNMYVYPLMRGGLLIINPMIVKQDVLDQILALGKPSILVCLSDTWCPVHTKDVRAWRQKFPDSIFCCPNSAYYRLLRDIPLVDLKDLTIEIQMHYDDVEVVFPSSDRKEVAFLLQIKDSFAFTSSPHFALVTGEMLRGKNEEIGEKEEMREKKDGEEKNEKIMFEPPHLHFLSILLRKRSSYSLLFNNLVKRVVFAAFLPSHGAPVVDNNIIKGRMEVSKESDSSSLLSSPYYNSPSSPSLPPPPHYSCPSFYPFNIPIISSSIIEEEKKNSIIQIMLNKLINSFGNQLIDERKRD